MSLRKERLQYLYNYLLFQLDFVLCTTWLVTNKWINNQSNSERWGLPAIPKYWIEKKVFYFFSSVHFNESFEIHWWILCIFHLQTVLAWLWQVLNVFSKNFSFHFFRTDAITWNKKVWIFPSNFWNFPTNYTHIRTRSLGGPLCPASSWRPCGPLNIILRTFGTQVMWPTHPRWASI